MTVVYILVAWIKKFIDNLLTIEIKIIFDKFTKHFSILSKRETIYFFLKLKIDILLDVIINTILSFTIISSHNKI